MKNIICILALSVFLTGKLFSTDLVIEENTQSVVCSINEFASDFYRQSSLNKNFCFSPYSLFSSLTMANAGAKGPTSFEIEKALHLQLNQTDLPLAMRSLWNNLTPPPKEFSYSINIANALWIKQEISIIPDYCNMIQNGWTARVSSLNFSDSWSSCHTINSWVSSITKKHIPELLNPSDISSSTQLILTNAIYFQGSWSHLFKKESTKKAPFYSNEKAYVSVDMMEQTSRFPYYENADLQMLIMPIKSDSNSSGVSSFAAFFLLPKEYSLESVERSLTSSSLTEWIRATTSSFINVKLPRFTIKSRIHPKNALASMGINLAFSKYADFSGIVDGANLQIDKVVHEALFTINETGVTAAAATAIPFVTTYARRSPEPSIFFHVNHAFLFGIIDLNSGLVLFLGKMTDP